MKLKLRIKKFFGFKYLVNLNTKEIHDLNNNHKNCHVDLIKNTKYIRKRKLEKYLNDDFNGCRFCLKKHDEG